MLPPSLRPLLLILLLMGLARPGAAQSTPVFDAANGHWYQAVSAPGGIAWGDANAAAQALIYAGYPGHLVTITSAEENAFLLDHLPLPRADQWWIGAYQDRNAPDYREPGGGWRWVTSEPWSFTFWITGLPDNSQGAQDYAAIDTRYSDQWDDRNRNDLLGGYLVEFEPPITVGASQLVLFPNPALGGQPALGRVTLPQPAVAGGEVVPLASNNPAAATVPATVLVPAGASSATFVITTLSVTAPTPVLISTGGNFGLASVVLQVLPLPTPPAATGPNLLVNGSFEQPPVPAGQAYSTLGPGKLPGWTIVRGTVDVDQEWQQAPGQGHQSLDLVGDHAGTIEQSFATVPGQQYRFSGWISHDYGNGVSEGRADVYLNGTFFVQLYHNTPSSQANMQWLPFAYSFRATGTTTTLRLADVTGLSDLQGLVLDGLSVVPVGEPSR
jgi:Protein of unknown function (DUF642)/Lectin C-type domain